MNTWQKTVKYIAIAFAILLIVGIISGIFSIFTSFSFFFDEKDIVGEMETYDIGGDIKELDINIGAADFAIKTDDNFRIESNHKYLIVEEKDGCITISEKDHSWGSYKGKAKLELYIPKDMVFEKADIVTGAGIVSIDELSTDVLTLELGAGKVDIDKLIAADHAQINGGAGNVTIKGGTLSNLDLDMGVGELSLTSRLIGECDLDYGIGAAEIVLIGTAEDYCIEVDKGLGEATIDGKKIYDGGTYGTGENKIDIDGGVGKIEIRFKSMEK